MLNLPKKCEKTGKPKLSYSQINSWEEYRQDYIKQYFMGIKLPSSPYAEFGSAIGVARETGDYSKFSKEEQEILGSIPRIENCIYEREILLDMGEYVVQGFIDELVPQVPISPIGSKESYTIIDNKTGGKGKDLEYRKKDYLQTVIYRMALEQEGMIVTDTQVRFFARKGSHFKPPLALEGSVFNIPIEYSIERIDYATKKMNRIANEISELYSYYLKVR
jgi:hypothetical protein